MKIYGIIHNNGDGSSSIRWYSKDSADYVLSDDYEYFDDVQCNEGSPAEIITLPDGLNPEDIGLELHG